MAFALFGSYIQVYVQFLVRTIIFAIIGQTMATMMLVLQRQICCSEIIWHCNSVVYTLTDNFRC